MYTWPVTYHGELIYQKLCQYLQVFRKKSGKLKMDWWTAWRVKNIIPPATKMWIIDKFDMSNSKTGDTSMEKLDPDKGEHTKKWKVHTGVLLITADTDTDIYLNQSKVIRVHKFIHRLYTQTQKLNSVRTSVKKI